MKNLSEVVTEAQEYIKTVFPAHAMMHVQQWKDLTDCYIMAYMSAFQDGGAVEYLKFREEVKGHVGMRLVEFMDAQ